ncbi:MAG: hypothetical protein RBS80_28965 [Thermoguttaceae bacterium]|jgi:hypothetical protein|nr:hypothetical protein [Thermoguttaceae bacterium]
MTIVGDGQRVAWRAAVLSLLMAASAIVGCRGRGYEGERRASVSGTVTLGGEPVDGGVIQFVPVGGEGRKASASISGGRYDIPEASGPNVGPHRVMINWPKPTGQVSPDGEGMETAEAIPPQYHADSTLEAEIKAGKNTHDFEL